MKKFAVVAFLFGLVGVVGFAQAQDKHDPTGTWKWETKRKGKDGNEVTSTTTLKLEAKDGKLTGTLTTPGFGGGKETETKIEDGKADKGEVTFNVSRTFGKDKDQKITTKYKAKVDGDTMKGTATTDFNGKERTGEFEAKRAKADEKKK